MNLNDSSLTFLYIVFFIAILEYVIAEFITAAFVIPLQYEQSKVKNGLRILRKQMLIKGVLAFIVILASIMALTLRFFPFEEHVIRYIIVTMIAIHASGTLGKSYIDYRIYHQQYSEASKRLHEKFEKEEISQGKDKAASKLDKN
jgi:hypothetical protein